ncbi:hypothetical protein BLA29_012510, partial [Euroglyphus maynei]
MSCSCSCSTTGPQSGKSCSYCSSLSQTNKTKISSTSYVTTTDFQDGIESTIGSKIFHAVDGMIDVALSQPNQFDSQCVSGSATTSCSVQSNQPTVNTAYVSGSSAVSAHSSLLKNSQSS